MALVLGYMVGIAVDHTLVAAAIVSPDFQSLDFGYLVPVLVDVEDAAAVGELVVLVERIG